MTRSTGLHVALLGLGFAGTATAQIGTAAPTLLRAHSPDGSWSVICQARVDSNKDGALRVSHGHHGDTYGDAMTPFLVMGTGAGTPIDAFVTKDRAGAWLVVVRKQRLILIEAATKKETDLTALGADSRDDPSPFGGHRAASIDVAGKRLVYIRKRANKVRVVVRELATGVEKELDPGTGDLWRAALDPDGNFVAMRVVARDTNGDGKLSWPAPRTTLAGRTCMGSPRSYSTHGNDGDTAVVRIAAIAGGRTREVNDLVRSFGPALLRRVNDALVVEENGKTTELVPATCGGRLVDADAAKGIVIVRCQKQVKLAKVPVVLYSRTGKVDLGLQVQEDDDDDSSALPGRLLFLGYDNNDLAYLDSSTQKVHRIKGDSGGYTQQLYVHGNKVLFRRKEKLFTFDVDVAKETQVKVPPLADYPDQDYVGAMALIEPNVIDIAKGTVVGTVPDRPPPLAVATDGRVLVAKQAAPNAAWASSDLPFGPLVWTAPTAAPALPAPKPATPKRP